MNAGRSPTSSATLPQKRQGKTLNSAARKDAPRKLSSCRVDCGAANARQSFLFEGALGEAAPGCALPDQPVAVPLNLARRQTRNHARFVLIQVRVTDRH